MNQDENNHDDWDYENAEVHPGRLVPRTSFSVRLKPAELEAIRVAAVREEMTVSDFIRRAALAAADGEDARADPPLSTLVRFAREHGAVISIAPAAPAAS